MTVKLYYCQWVFLGLLLAPSTHAALAHTQPWQLGISLGYGQQQDPFISQKNEDIYFLLDIAYYGRYAFFDNGDIGIYLYNDENRIFNCIATRKNARDIYDPVSHLTRGIRPTTSSATFFNNEGSPVIASSSSDNTPIAAPIIDIPSRKHSTEAGFEFVAETRWGHWQTQWLRDISDTHDGNEFWLAYSSEQSVANGYLRYALGASIQDRRYIDYYYGVRTHEASPLLPTYDGRQSINHFAKLGYSYPLREQVHLLGLVHCEFFGTGITNSPLLHRDTSTTWFLGVYYTL